MNSDIHFGPVVYEHAATFMDESPYTVSRSAALLAEAHARAYEFYRHSPIAVGIDVYNIEAEAYGARVPDPGGRDIPSVAAPIADSAAALSSLPDWDIETGSRFGLAFQAAAELRRRFPEADIRIPLGGPFSIASNLLGFDNLLCECLTDARLVRDALLMLADKQVAVATAVAARGFGIAFFESAAAPPLLSPQLFRQVELPALQRFCEGARRALGRDPAIIMGGDTLPVLDDLLSLSPGFLICPGETDQNGFMTAMRARPDIAVRLNMQVAVLVNGSLAQVKAEVDRTVAIARRTAVPGRAVLVGTGVLPIEADPALIRRIGAYIMLQQPLEG
jgi:uroporphyrinogen-III decarboxylase